MRMLLDANWAACALGCIFWAKAFRCSTWGTPLWARAARAYVVQRFAAGAQVPTTYMGCRFLALPTPEPSNFWRTLLSL